MGVTALFLEVIVFVIILLFVGLPACRVLIVTARTVMVLIVSMTIGGSTAIAIALIA
jgi:hypothetical protein